MKIVPQIGYAKGHQGAQKEQAGHPQTCSKINISMIMSSHWWISSLINTLASGWFWQFLQKNPAVFGCLTNALAPPPITLESCSTTQTDRPV